ncbi:MAG: hypothetical protein NWF00_04330 [Candidatus Bathyarchaeota archaeon]|nr:hypothetical protein [Candidatus Bathyarchaeota archaeon]
MKKAAVNKDNLQTLDLATLDGEGSFPCPTCGTLISPDDESEEVYQIIDTKMAGDELAELVICCGTCKTIIRITGFQQLLTRLPNE